MVYTFGIEPELRIPFRTILAEVTPDEFDKLRAQSSRLPADWDLSKARRFKRLKAA